MSYETKRTDILDFTHHVQASYIEKGDEVSFEYCPYCNGGESRDKYTFSVNTKSGAFCCLRSTCGHHGHFVELCRDFDYRLEYDVPRIYRTLPQPKEIIKPKSEAVQYLESRGISQEIAERYEITVQTDNPFILCFPFYDEKGKLQTVKYRNTKFKKGKTQGSKEWFEKDTMPILFGMKQCEDFTTLVITEGQIDSLSLAEAGIKNACSVPNGAVGFTWLDHCYEWVKNFEDIIVFGDCENGKVTLIDKLKQRLPEEHIRCVRKIDYLGEKDANDILIRYGTEALWKAIENAEVPKIENVKDLSAVRSVDINALDKIKTGIKDIDRVLGGLCMGQLVILTGKRGEGKSTLGSQICCAALEQNEKFFAYSGELADFHFKRWIDYQLAGNRHIEAEANEYGDMHYSIPEETIERINDWYKGRAFIFDNNYLPDDKSELGGIVETIERVIRQYGTRLIFIDNLMTAMDVVTQQDNLYLAQSNFVGQLKKIAMKYDVVVLLVAHPRKSREEFSNDDVSGSSDITNKADVVMSYQRAGKDAEEDGLLFITKNRLTGKLRVGKDNAIKLGYSEKTKRIFSWAEPTETVYSWETTSGLMEDEDDLPFLFNGQMH